MISRRYKNKQAIADGGERLVGGSLLCQTAKKAHLRELISNSADVSQGRRADAAPDAKPQASHPASGAETNAPDPRHLTAADGQPRIPSFEAEGAKKQTLCTAAADQGGHAPMSRNLNSKRAVTHFPESAIRLSDPMRIFIGAVALHEDMTVEQLIVDLVSARANQIGLGVLARCALDAGPAGGGADLISGFHGSVLLHDEHHESTGVEKHRNSSKESVHG